MQFGRSESVATLLRVVSSLTASMAAISCSSTSSWRSSLTMTMKGDDNSDVHDHEDNEDTDTSNECGDDDGDGDGDGAVNDAAQVAGKMGGLWQTRLAADTEDTLVFGAKVVFFSVDRNI